MKETQEEEKENALSKDCFQCFMVMGPEEGKEEDMDDGGKTVRAVSLVLRDHDEIQIFPIVG